MASRLIISALATVVTVFSFAATAQEVNIYSARHYDTDLALYDGFTEQTGIRVNVIEGNSDQMIERIVNEGEFSPADLLVTVDAGRLWRAENRDIFQSTSSDILNERVPVHLRHPEGLWFGIAKRGRIIMYNKEAGRPEGLDDYEDLANPEFRGMVCVRSSSNIYNISLMASMVEHHGEEGALEWARGVVANFAREPQGNDTAQIRAAAAGECRIAIANTYYLARLKGSDDADDRAVANAVGVLFPNQSSRGAHVNISGAGVLKHAPNRENAVRFLEYLTTEPAQTLLAKGSNEYPAVASVAVSGPVAELGAFKDDTVNAGALGRNQTLAVQLFDRAGWK